MQANKGLQFLSDQRFLQNGNGGQLAHMQLVSIVGGANPIRSRCWAVSG